jgi:hypothetical protein
MTSNVDSIDTDVSSYTLSELMAIIGITEQEDLTSKNIENKTNYYINKYKTSNPTLSTFFLDIQSQLLQYSSELNDTSNKEDATYPAGEAQTQNWYQNQALKQSDQNQVNKITDRIQKIDVYGNPHLPMNREELGINNNFQLDVKQDTLNPNLKNTINKFVNIDSQFRQYTGGIETSSTNFTLDLSETLNNALSIKLYSYQLPYSWYSIDIQYGNTCFWITNGSNNIPISIPPGNYTTTTFVNVLNQEFVTAGFSNFQGPPATYSATLSSLLYPVVTPGSYVPVYINQSSGMLVMFLNGAHYTAPVGSQYTNFTVSSQTPGATVITFFDPTAQLLCQTTCLNNNNYYNSTLGWLMGFRTPYQTVNANGNMPTSIIDLNGPKYLMLIVDDYNQNHINSNIVSIAEYSNILKMPSYYSTDLPYTCLTPDNTVSNISSLTTGENAQQQLDNNQFSPDGGLLIAGKLNVEYTNAIQVLPSAPRLLTQSQIYTINQISANRNNNTNYRAKAPTNNDVLAILPISPSGTSTGQLMVENGSALQVSARVYFGPVNIERLHVKLVDDKGNIVNLNGNDWCFTLICECLYQY